MSADNFNDLMMKSFLWRIGGPQGSGIDRGALLFARACAKQGLHVLGRREYHSNIIGRHSYSDMRVGTEPVYGHSASPRLLVCLDAEAICRHANVIAPHGCIVYDESDANTELSKLKFLDEYLKHYLREQLQRTDQPFNVAGLLTNASDKAVMTLGIPYKSLCKRLRDKCDVSRSTSERSRNVLAVAVSAALLGLPQDLLCSEVEQIFHDKEAVIAVNRHAIKIAYDYVQSLAISLPLSLAQLSAEKDERLWLNGTQSVALGKLAAGLGIQTYYPISPATDESLYLESHNNVPLENGEETGPVVLQTEDELAAITMACGAALTGARVATSTSGPGFSLMAEGLGWAGMNEVPIVVSLYQRGGPSTGMPTRTEQGDLQFAVHAGHGEFPRIVIASGDVEECFYDSFRAFNYAARYQLPVIHMLDKNLASTTQTLCRFDTENLKIERGILFSHEGDDGERQQRFHLTDTGISARLKLGEDGQAHWTTGVEHTEWGLVSEDPVIRARMMEKRAQKLKQAAKEIPYTEKLMVFGDENAALTVISWGSNKGVLVEAAQLLCNQSIPVRIVMVRLLWPFPIAELEQLTKSANPLIVLECNQSGQLNQLLMGNLGRSADHLVLKYNGRPHTLEEVTDSLRRIYAGKAEQTIMHQNIYE